MDSPKNILLLTLLTLSMPTPFAANTKAAPPLNRGYPRAKAQKGDFIGFNFLGKFVTINEAFADKSLLIKDFVEYPAKVVLVTCPRGWGKTMNLGMMEMFFQPQISDSGKRADKPGARNYKLFALGKWDDEKIAPMKIAKHRDFVDRYLGQHPVIFLILGVFSYGFDALKLGIGLLFETHLYVINRFEGVLNNSSAGEAEKKAAQAHKDLFIKLFKRNFTEEESIGSLKFLSERLHEYFGRKPFIFLDDYDKAINELVTSHIDIKFSAAPIKQSANCRVEFLRRFLFATFVENDHFEKGLVTGEMSLEIPRIFSGLPNFKHFNVIRNEFFRYFGLTEDEVNLSMELFQIKGKLAEDAKKWIGGYSVTNNVNASLYNIESVRDLLRNRAIGYVMDGTSNSHTFNYLLRKGELKPIVASLVNGTGVALELNDLAFTVDDYHTLCDMLEYEAKITESGINAYLRLLVSEGFLTIDNACGSSALARGYVKLPNEQVAKTLMTYCQ